ncbi:MAG: phosphopantetheine-binding protein [Burkholderiales bacterium]
MNPLFERIVEAIRAEAEAGVLPGHLRDMALTAETRLAELGIDSLGRMSLLTTLMDLTDRYFADGTFQDHHTLAEIAAIAAAPR